MKTEGRTKMFWVIGIIIILIIVVSGYFVYARHRDNQDFIIKQKQLEINIQELNQTIIEKDAIIEQIQKDIAAKEKEKQIVDARYKKLKNQLLEKVKEGEAIQKPEGKDEILKGFNKHGYNPTVRE